MIRINLLGEKVDRSGAYFFHGLALAASAVVSLLLCVVVHSSVSTRLELANNQKLLLDNQLKKLREKTKKVEDLEKDKKLLSEKLTTIARLKAKKTGPVHLLDDITGSIPERSWLVAIKQKSDGLEFQGIALDPQTVSTFMTTLGASKWIQNVELVYSKQVVKQDVAIQEFSLLVKLRNALEVNKPKEAGKPDKDAKEKGQAKDAGSAAGANAAPAGQPPAEAPPAESEAAPAETAPAAAGA